MSTLARCRCGGDRPADALGAPDSCGKIGHLGRLDTHRFKTVDPISLRMAERPNERALGSRRVGSTRAPP